MKEVNPSLCTPYVQSSLSARCFACASLPRDGFIWPILLTHIWESTIRRGFVLTTSVLESDKISFSIYMSLHAEIVDCLRDVFQYQQLESYRKDRDSSSNINGVLSLSGQVAAGL